jgi:hypothetical protein
MKKQTINAQLKNVADEARISRPAYAAPELVAVGTAAELVQGNQTTATYYDRFTIGMTYFPNV